MAGGTKSRLQTHSTTDPMWRFNYKQVIHHNVPDGGPNVPDVGESLSLSCPPRRSWFSLEVFKSSLYFIFQLPCDPDEGAHAHKVD